MLTSTTPAGASALPSVLNLTEVRILADGFRPCASAFAGG